MAGAEVAVDGVRNRATGGDGNLEHVLLCVLDALLDCQRDLGGLTLAKANVALAVTDDDESDERHAVAALHGLGNTVDVDYALLKIGVILALTITWHSNSS